MRDITVVDAALTRRVVATIACAFACRVLTYRLTSLASRVLSAVALLCRQQVEVVTGRLRFVR